MYCYFCGAELKENAAFCTKCGGRAPQNPLVQQPSAPNRQPTYAQPLPPANTQPVKIKQATASLILSIASLCTYPIPLAGAVSPVLAIVALILGIVAKGRAKRLKVKSVKSTIGIIIAAIAIALFTLSFFLGFFEGLTGSYTSDDIMYL